MWDPSPPKKIKHKKNLGALCFGAVSRKKCVVITMWTCTIYERIAEEKKVLCIQMTFILSRVWLPIIKGLNALGHSHQLFNLSKKKKNVWSQIQRSSLCHLRKKRSIYSKDVFDLAALNSMTSSCFSSADVWPRGAEDGEGEVWFTLLDDLCPSASALAVRLSGGERPAKFTFLCMWSLSWTSVCAVPTVVGFILFMSILEKGQRRRWSATLGVYSTPRAQAFSAVLCPFSS